MRELWNFMTKEKLEKFLEILKHHDIEYEITSAVKNKYVVSVDDADYVKAKRVLLKHRERRTSGDSIKSNDSNQRME